MSKCQFNIGFSNFNDITGEKKKNDRKNPTQVLQHNTHSNNPLKKEDFDIIHDLGVLNILPKTNMFVSPYATKM
jgi:hypothetical protein